MSVWLSRAGRSYLKQVLSMSTRGRWDANCESMHSSPPLAQESNLDNSVYVLPNAAVGGFEKTVLVFGCGRGGTSMVAGALRELGVNMGEHLHPLKHESNFFEPGMTPQEVNAKIAHYNGRYPVWGWKCPGDIFSISKFAHQLRNPHFVVVMRSMYGILMSNYRHLGISPELAIGDVGTVFDEIGRFVTNCPYPVAMVGYEAAVQQPATFIDGVAGFLGLTDISEGTRANATAFVSGSRKYKAVAAENATQAHQEERMAVDNIYDGVVNKISILSARVRDRKSVV